MRGACKGTYMTWFISYDAIYNSNQQTRKGNYGREQAHVERIINQVLRNPREHVEARQNKIHVVVHIRLHLAFSKATTQE